LKASLKKNLNLLLTVFFVFSVAGLLTTSSTLLMLMLMLVLMLVLLLLLLVLVFMFVRLLFHTHIKNPLLSIIFPSG